ncbi:YchJ family protein [Mariniluteicoccus flavus]
MTNCPCGSAATLDDHCGPLLAGVRQAATPEELMRSRYTAYVTGDEDYVFRTWHPRTRPTDVTLDGVDWVGLDIIDATGGEVEFVARFVLRGKRNVLHERSRFEQRAGRWFYVDGDVK